MNRSSPSSLTLLFLRRWMTSPKSLYAGMWKYYIRAIKEEKVKVEVVNQKEYLYLLRGIVWLQIIPPELDMKQVRTEMRERMHIEGAVQNTLILQRLTPPLWGQVLISSKYLKSNRNQEGNHDR